MPPSQSSSSAQAQKTLLSVLIDAGFLTSEQAALLPVNASNKVVEQAVTSQGLVSPEDLLRAYAQLYGIPFVRLKKNVVPPDMIKRIPEIVARRYDLVAYDEKDGILYVAMAAPSQMKDSMQSGLLHRLQEQLQLKIAPAFAPLNDIRSLFTAYAPVSQLVKPEEAASAQPIMPTSSDVEEASVQTAVSSTSAQYPTISLADKVIADEMLKKIPAEVATRYQLMAFGLSPKGELQLAVVNPQDPEVISLLAFIREHNDLALAIYQTDAKSFQSALQQYPGMKQEKQVELPGEKQSSQAVAQSVAPIANQPAAPIANSQPVQAASVASTVKVSTQPVLAEAPTAEPDVAPAPVVPSIKANEIERSTLLTSSSALTIDTFKSPVMPGNTGQPSQQGENTLDSFLGRPITSVGEAIQIIKSGNVPKIVAAILSLAIAMRASDIHIEATKDDLRLRYRVDGELTDILTLPQTLLAPIVSRIKILSEMKIDENRIPQDGRFNVQFSGRDIDLRVSTLPTVHGEKVVMRILDKTTGILKLTDMGVDGVSLKRIEENIRKPYGIVLASGPTGSGKSTTLYAVLQEISSPTVNIVTLEDPVEYEIKGINQTQIKPKIGFTFAEGLRSILRQDPNVIMVGEVRDAETAEMATHAALTGHLVLSTLHTNTAAGGLPRLINMGIEPFLITSSINAIIGQRLVRRLCQQCKVEVHLPQDVIEEINAELKDSNVPAEFKDPSRWHFFRGQGCPECNNGYKGRVGIFEVLSMSEKIEELAIAKAPESAIEDQAVKEGMITMKQDGLMKAISGVTTVEEIMKAATE